MKEIELKSIYKKNNVNGFTFSYGSGKTDVEGFLFRPNDKKKYPVVIYNRGGYKDYFEIGKKIIDNHLAKIASHGFIVLASQYREHDELGGKDLEDVLALKDIIDNLPFANKKSISMIGYSRGGLMTYLAMAKVNWIKHAVVVGAPTNLLHTIKYRPDVKKIMKEAFGATEYGYKKRSAINYVKKFHKDTRLLIMHGFNDRRVKVTESLELSSRLHKVNFDHRLIVFESDGHYLGKHSEEVESIMISWMKR